MPVLCANRPQELIKMEIAFVVLVIMKMAYSN
jgi:hypothetical protein